MKNIKSLFSIFLLHFVLTAVLGQEAFIQVKSDSSFKYGPNYDDRQHNITQICNEHGFEHYRYSVTTQDGYILSLDRIPPFGKDIGDPNFEAPVVMLQHGIEDSSIAWVLNTIENAPAFILSRAGYDVWLGNNRGNSESRRHVKFRDD